MKEGKMNKKGVQEVYESHPAKYGETCPVCGVWEDEKCDIPCTNVNYWPCRNKWMDRPHPEGCAECQNK